MTIKYRYFPFLGFRTFDDEDKMFWGIPQGFTVKALVFEWMSFAMILLAKAAKENNNTNGN